MSFHPSAIIVHGSASRWGCAIAIHEWHVDPARPGGPFSRIGYHAIGCNGRLWGSGYEAWADGLIEAGRSMRIAGAHVDFAKVRPGVGISNGNSLGFCLVGTSAEDFTTIQLDAARSWILGRMEDHGIALAKVLGHYEVQTNKIDPYMPMERFREFLAGKFDSAAMLAHARAWAPPAPAPAPGR